MNKALFQSLPSIDALLNTEFSDVLCQKYSLRLVKAALTKQLETARTFIKKSNQLPSWLENHAHFFAEIEATMIALKKQGICPVYNVTGTLLHTNLGRVQQSQSAIDAVVQSMSQACTLEYDLSTGARGQRDGQIEYFLKALTGAEAACVVNNNAAAVLLMLNVLAKNRSVIVSRGELVEIGGSFRMPDIMESASCTLKEVGATNRTHLKDYEAAINENTGALMKVHPSNYAMTGFTTSVSEKALATLAHQYNLPIISDLGAGALIDLSQYGLPKERKVQDLINDDVDLISFSGDKLIGGPQAGIIVGKKIYIDQLQKHPLKRALRCDKMTIAALEATLKEYLYADDLTKKLPYLMVMTRTLADIKTTAEKIHTALMPLLKEQFTIEVNHSTCQVGSGALPDETLPSYALCLMPKKGGSSTLLILEEALRALPIPVITRISQEALWMDCRTVADLNGFIDNLNTLVL